MLRSGSGTHDWSWVWILGVLSAAGALLGCAGGGLAAREARLGSVHALTAPSGAYTASVALPYTQVDEDGIDRIDVALGEGATDMACYVYTEEIDLGLLAFKLARLQGDHLEETLGDFEVKQLTDLRGGEIGGAAYHALELTYSDSAHGTAQIKAAAANQRGLGVACNDMNLGFRETFHRVFASIVESLEPTQPLSAPYFREIVVTLLAGQPVGVSESRLTLDADGDTEMLSMSSTLLGRGGVDIMANFSLDQRWARPDGSLINARSVELDPDSVVTQLELSPGEDGSWRISGTYQSKAFEGVLGHVGAIDTPILEYRGMQQLAPHGDSHALRLALWLPEADPMSIIEASYDVSPEDPSQVRMEAAGLVMEGRRGPEGLIDSGQLQVGPAKMELEKVHRSGEP